MRMSTKNQKILRGPNVQPLSRLALPMYLVQKLRENGNTTLLIDAEEETRQLTNSELLARSSRLTEALRARGVGPGDFVGVCSENSILYPVAVFAAIFSGAACAPLNYSYTARELQHALSLTRPKVIFFSNFTAAALLEALSQSSWASPRPLLVRLPDGDDEGEEEEGVLTLSGLINSVPAPTNFKPHKPADPASSVALVLCSSGTTGLPKGVMITHVNLMVGISNPLHSNYQIQHNNTVFPGHLPFFHAFGFMCIAGAIVRNFTIVVMPYFSPDTLLRIIQDHKVSTIPLVPPLMQFLAHSEMVGQYDLSSLRHVSCGAAPLSRELQNAVMKRLNIPDIRQGYGLTECTLAALMVPNGRNKPGTSGCVVPGMEAKVIDETGKLLGPGERGELCFRGVLVMKGYINDPKATAEAIDSEGWLHTGDVGFYDKDGCFFIVDRLKELIKYKAFQVPPAELETILQTHPGIEDAAVVGVPDVESGELPLAFVVRKDPALTEEQVKRFVAEQVSPQKRLRGGVRFIDVIPKNPSGKILRRELRQLLNSKL